MSAQVKSFEDRPYQPMLEEIEAAFKAVFPNERLQQVEYTGPGAKEIFAITSDKMTRRYLRNDASRSFEDILRGTPHIAAPKE